MNPCAGIDSPANRQEDDPSAIRDTLKLVTATDLNKESLTGFRISKYELGKRIGVGGMGQVYFARHTTLGKPFAVKFMSDDVRNCVEGEQRFQKEVASLGRLRHPNIVSAVDAGTAGTLQYLVTELVEGIDLSQHVRTNGILNELQAREIITQAARGLAYAHQMGFIHRDIKPSNLILDNHGVVRLLDFGLVRSQDRRDDLTSPGQLLGTIDFLSPEQAADGRSADHRSDLYGLGCTLLFLLTGHMPFYGDQYSSMATRIHGHLFEEPPAMNLLNSEITPNLRHCLSRLIAKKPNDRFQSANELLAALGETAVAGTSTPTRPRPARRPRTIIVTGLLGSLAFVSLAEIGRRFGGESNSSRQNTSVAMTETGTPQSDIQPEQIPSEPTEIEPNTPDGTPVAPPDAVTPPDAEEPASDPDPNPHRGPIDWEASNRKLLGSPRVRPSFPGRRKTDNDRLKAGMLAGE